MGRVRVSRLAAGVAVSAALVLPAAPASAAPAQVRAFDAVAGTARFTVAVDGRTRARRLGFEQATRRFGLAPGIHTVVVRNAAGRRLVRVRVAVRSGERVTLAIAGTAARPTVAPVREAKALDDRSAWTRIANLVRGRNADLVLAGQSFTMVRNVRFAKTSKAVRVPSSAGYYAAGGVQLSLRMGGSILDTQAFQFSKGSALTIVALPDGRSAKLRALPR
jgi:hypothetical protein